MKSLTRVLFQSVDSNSIKRIYDKDQGASFLKEIKHVPGEYRWKHDNFGSTPSFSSIKQKLYSRLSHPETRVEVECDDIP